MGRPNPQNLRVPTSEQARRNGSKGGKASAESKKRKKTMMELMERLLTEENTDPVLGKSVQRLGFEENDNVHMARIVTEVMRKAENGDLKAVELIVKMLYGESQNVNVNLEGKLETTDRVQIYLPEIEKEKEE